MKSNLKELVADLKLPYLRALLLIALIPLFPEYVSFFFAIAAFFFAWKDIRQQNKKIHIGIIGKLLFTYCAYVTITAIFSAYKLQCIAVALMWWFFFLVYLAIVNLVTDEDRMDAFLMCITGVAGIIGLIACVQYRLNFFIDSNFGSIWSWLDEIVFPLVPFEICTTAYQIRAYSSFANPNMLAQYLVMVAPFVICFNFVERRRKLRLFSRISLFLTFAGILFSFSRGAYIALLVLGVALVVINIRRKFAAVSLYIVSVLLFLPEEVITRLFSVRTGISSSSQIAETVIGSIDTSIPLNGASNTVAHVSTDASINQRWQMWFQSIGSILERPFFGYGVGTEPSTHVLENVGGSPPHAHNLILQLLLEGGIFALILMSLIGFLTVKNGLKLIRCGSNASFWYGFATLAFATCFVLHGMVDYPLTTPKLICCFITALAIIEQSLPLFRDGRPYRRLLRT